MSKYIDFYNKINADVYFAAEYRKIMNDKHIPSGTPFSELPGDALNALIPLAASAGLIFTPDELKTRFSKKHGDELSDGELEAVAGGGSKSDIPDKINIHHVAWDDPSNTCNPANKKPA